MSSSHTGVGRSGTHHRSIHGSEQAKCFEGISSSHTGTGRSWIQHHSQRAGERQSSRSPLATRMLAGHATISPAPQAARTRNVNEAISDSHTGAGRSDNDDRTKKGSEEAKCYRGYLKDPHGCGPVTQQALQHHRQRTGAILSIGSQVATRELAAMHISLRHS